ncbi:unnamed protein product [Paramecium sonneborni]|uniref:Uncharacterized protein n=1 Tax=Paramecium sonneborni TaxID=65129 RepID=A0A8S1NZV0_9CILI|nr:unnamed protein product [Paramecium sonneborni]
MQEIEAQKQQKASEGAHFFYKLIFISASGIIETQFIEQNVIRIFDYLYIQYSMDEYFWELTYLLLQFLVIKKQCCYYNLFFNFLDICFGIYLILLLFYGGKMYFTPKDCLMEAPILFFLETFLLVYRDEKYIRQQQRYESFYLQRNHLCNFDFAIYIIFTQTILKIIISI